MNIPHPHDADEPCDDLTVEGESHHGDCTLIVRFRECQGFRLPDGSWEPWGLDDESMTLTIDGDIVLTDDDEIREALAMRGIDVDELVNEAREEAQG